MISKIELLEFLRKNRSGGLRCGNGEMVSISGYLNRWERKLEDGSFEVEDVRNCLIKLVDKRRGIREGENVGYRIMNLLEVEGYEKGEKDKDNCLRIKVSLKELGLICLGLELMDLEEEGLWEDREICEKLNERLVKILEREDN